MPQTNIKQSLIAEIEKRVNDKILEPSNAKLLTKLIQNADSDDEAIQISALGTMYKRTGLHFQPKLEPSKDNTIRYFKENEKLSFYTDDTKPTNKLIIGDNYEALQNLLIQYKGKIDVIYIDPPYGKDSMGEFAKTNYQNAITRDNLLSMLYLRLTLAKQLLSDDGVIFCSIDDKNQAYVKCLFDEVFGEENFITTFIWRKTSNPNTTGNNIGIEHEYVHCFSKSSEYTLRGLPLDEKDSEKYVGKDEYFDVRGPYKLVGLNKTGTVNDIRPNLTYDIKAPDESIIKPNPRWRWSKEKFEKGIEENRIVFNNFKGKWTVSYKQYLNEDTNGNIIERKKLIKTILDSYGRTTDGTSELTEILGKGKFDFPKPTELIKILVYIASISNSSFLV